jgi:hypothetical protein
MKYASFYGKPLRLFLQYHLLTRGDASRRCLTGRCARRRLPAQALKDSAGYIRLPPQ